MAFSYSEYIDIFNENVNRIVGLYPVISQTIVPTCSPWTGFELSEHCHMVFSRAKVRIGLTEQPTNFVFIPASTQNAPHALKTSKDVLVKALRHQKPESPAWNWTGTDMTVRWLARRMAHESAIHYLDAAITSDPTTINRADHFFKPEFASDGIAEFLENFLFNIKVEKTENEKDSTIHLHSNDSKDCSWVISFNNESVIAKHGEAKDADADVTGTSSALYGWIWNRFSTDTLTVTGDQNQIDQWRNKITV